MKKMFDSARRLFRGSSAKIDALRQESTRKWEERLAPDQMLLADDDLLFTELLVSRCERWNVNFVTARSVADAMVQLKENAKLKAALLDIVLLNGSGIDLYRWIVVNRPSLNTVFITGYPVSAYEDEIRQIGPARIVHKSRLTDAEFIEQLMLQLNVTRLKTG